MINLADVPADLVTQAVILGGEPAWPPSAARQVIECLRQNEVAVLGIETWLPRGDFPLVLLSWCSRYDVKFTGDWQQYVEENARQALADLSSAEQSEDVPREMLVNLTWVNPEGWNSLH